MLARLLITRRIYPEALARLEPTFEVVHNQDTDIPFSPEQLAAHLARSDYLFSTVADRLDASVLGAASSLRLVAQGAVGINNIDLAHCAAHGIAVTNTPGVLDETTADFAWALMMATARRIPESERAVRDGQWKGWAFDQFAGVDIHGATLGILGMGRIGSAIARRAQGFGMEVLFHNRTPSDSALARYVGKAELLARADFVIVVVPYTPQTHHLIRAEDLAQMKSSACLINIARGGVVDDAALVAALASGRIRAAGLDVFEHEPALHPGFLELQNVVLTPHIASSSRATRLAMQNLAIDNLLAHRAGAPLKTPVALPGSTLEHKTSV